MTPLLESTEIKSDNFSGTRRAISQTARKKKSVLNKISYELYY